MRAYAVGIALLALTPLAVTTVAGGRTDPSPDSTTARARPAITILSGRPDTVTGGDALVRVDVPAGVPPERIRVTVGGEDVTDAFRIDRTGRTLTGLVDGLGLGANRIRADVRGRPGGATLVVRNHPLQGPVFSGPHQQPYACETTRFELPVIGGTLGEPLDADCSVADRVDYFYRTKDGAFAPWPEGTDTYPADLARTTTSQGVDVPYIVRMETGTVNRAIYQTTVLHDPLTEPEPTPFDRPAGWNGRAIFTLGGGCTNGWYRQGNRTGGVTDDVMLRQGYAVLSSSLNVFGNNCSDLTAAETAMMVKERFIERYGPVEHTIGFGSSGGSYQAHQIADNYPGIVDGIIVGESFPEVGFATVNFITDAWLLDHYFTTTDTEWTLEQKRAVTGFLQYATAPNVAASARRVDPRAFCDIVPAELRYDPETNPTGVRCGVYDHAVNVYGRDPRTGFARRPLDNVGIQYGLAALNDGTISVDQFLDLNEHIGGFDHDANIRPERSVADLKAVRTAYRTGRLTNGGGGLATTPIIDYRSYLDDAPGGNIHLRYHSLSMKARLLAANGTAANHVSLLEDNRYGNFSTRSPLLRHAISAMDRWLTLGHRPPDLREGCMTRDADPTFIAEPLDRDPGSTCERLYPSASFPREVAGESIAADVIKCRRKPIDRDDYAVEMTPAQWDRLARIFPDGVCDYSRPGIGQQGLAGTWLRF